jgi:hypothetical protein
MVFGLQRTVSVGWESSCTTSWTCDGGPFEAASRAQGSQAALWMPKWRSGRSCWPWGRPSQRAFSALEEEAEIGKRTWLGKRYNKRNKIK